MRDKYIKTLKMVAEDAEKDVIYYEGKPFTGRNVAEFFGKQAAGIKAIAVILQCILEKKDEI